MKTNRPFIYFALLAAFLTISTSAFADVKIKIRQTAGGQSSENTTYIKGKRQRAEMAGGMMVSVMQCDLQRDIQISPQTKTYVINPYDNSVGAAGSTATSKTVESTRGGTVTTTVTSKDTGERKQMFGYTARHIIQTIETVSSPDSCNPVNSKMEIDAWYIDATFAVACDTNRQYRPYQASKNGGGCQDKLNVKTVGAAKTGYPVYQKMTMFDNNGQPNFSTVQEVLEISNTTLDAGLFDIPQGYREVKNASEMYSSAAMQSASSSSGSGNYGSQNYGQSYGSNSGASNSSIAQNVQKLSQNNSNISTSNGAEDKKPGVVRLGLANVKTGSVGEGLNAQDLAAAIKNSLVEYLKTPKIELVQLEAKLPSAIADEAKEKQCDYVIYVNVSHKKGGGGGGFGGMFGKVLAPAIGATGLGNTGSTAGNIAGAVATRSIVSAGQMSSNVKSKDEITLDVKLVSSADDSSPLAKQYKAKAKSDGEDIISPIIEQAAQAILDSVKK
jgi:hypothetical protein